MVRCGMVESVLLYSSITYLLIRVTRIDRTMFFSITRIIFPIKAIHGTQTAHIIYGKVPQEMIYRLN
jgi:hypothetical protein